MINEGFTAGVDLGGLVSQNEIKILICYMLNSVKAPLSGNFIIDIFQRKALANYFETTDAISSLKRQGHIINCEGDVFVLSETGKEISVNLERSLPTSVKEKALETAIALLGQAKLEKENNVEIIKIENGYNVICHISGGGFDLMSFTVYVPDLSQAKIVKKNFHKNPEHIYKLMLTTIVENENLFDVD
ncbi:MAG: DUF4364 family protein [Clostridia bacterium]